MDEKITNLLEGLLAEMKENNKQISDRLAAIENSIEKFSERMNENSLNMLKELSSISDALAEIKYN